MKQDKRQRLEKAGWKVGSPDELLGLSPEEAESIDLRIRLGDAVRQLRKRYVLALGATRQDLARAIAGTQ